MKVVPMLDNLWFAAQKREKIGAKIIPTALISKRNDHSEINDMRRGFCGVFKILFADSSRDRRRCADRETERDGVNDRHHRFRYSDDRDRISAEFCDKKNIDDGEKAFHHHFQNHRNSKQKDRQTD